MARQQLNNPMSSRLTRRSGRGSAAILLLFLIACGNATDPAVAVRPAVAVEATAIETPALLAIATVAATETPRSTLTARPSAPATTPTAARTRAPATPTAHATGPDEDSGIVGYSFGGLPIEHRVFGSGPVNLAFVGAIHGGYEWNTANLAYALIDYFTHNPQLIPKSVTLHVIPVANPDGLRRVTPDWTTGAIAPPMISLAATFSGRFNGRNVDLNRNWDCEWTATALWRDQAVSGGDAAFSESETAALRDFFLRHDMRAVVFWHSAAGVVLPGRCLTDQHSPSIELAEVYSAASAYPLEPALTYEISGDASDWLTTQGVASIAVELTDHTAMEWSRNLAGLLAVLHHYGAASAEPQP